MGTGKPTDETIMGMARQFMERIGLELLEEWRGTGHPSDLDAIARDKRTGEIVAFAVVQARKVNPDDFETRQKIERLHRYADSFMERNCPRGSGEVRYAVLWFDCFDSNGDSIAIAHIKPLN